MKRLLLIIGILGLIFWLYPSGNSEEENDSGLMTQNEEEKSESFLVNSARKQIGVVTKYDTSYYVGGYPPEDRGACTDVIERALRDNEYDLKIKIDEDMANHPELYPHEPDPNINYRRVRNLKIFLDRHATSLPTCKDLKCIESTDWQAGDIVTYDQIPGNLWHVAIVSDKKTWQGIPLLIHNYGKGVVEDNKLLKWPAPMTGRYRLEI